MLNFLFMWIRFHICKVAFAIWSKEVPQLDLICQSYFHRGSTGDGRDLTVTQGSNRTCTSCVRQKLAAENAGVSRG